MPGPLLVDRKDPGEYPLFEIMFSPPRNLSSLQRRYLISDTISDPQKDGGFQMRPELRDMIALYI